MDIVDEGSFKSITGTEAHHPSRRKDAASRCTRVLQQP